MENRIIKFRAWDKKYSTMSSFEKMMENRPLAIAGRLDSDQFIVLPHHENIILMQYTGKKGFYDRELYEGDIVFYEESEDDGDKRYYLVIVWIAEWSMFASLHVDEYKKYIENGKDELDEPLFWTYTLEDSEHFHFAGTIYENPDLL